MPPKPPVPQKKKSKKASSETAKVAAKVAAGKQGAAEELDSIFSALNHSKNPSASATSSSTTSATMPAYLAQRAATAASERAARPPRDGLFHAPEKSMHMNDLGFFGGTVRGGRTVRVSEASAATAAGDEAREGEDDEPEVSEALLSQEGVNRILSMSALRKMLSRNPNAGSTPNCPFDCDCCF